MKKMAIAIMLMIGLVTVGCGANKTETNNNEINNNEINNNEIKANTEVKLETEVNNTKDITATKEIAKADITFDQIFTDPNILKTVLKTDLDYSKIIKNNATSVYFLDEDLKSELSGNYQMIYPLEMEDSTSLYLIFEANKLKEAKLDEFVGEVATPDNSFDFVFYNFEAMLEQQPKQEDFELDYKDLEKLTKYFEENYLNKSVYDINEYLGIYSPVSKIINLNNNKTLETYYLVSIEGYTASIALDIVIDNQIITKIHVDDVGNRAFDKKSLLK